MRKKKKRGKVNKKILVLLVLLFAVILAAAVSYLSQPQSQPKSVEKKPAEEYFRVFDARVDDGKPYYNDEGEMIAVVIYSMTFTIEPVGGNATNLIIESDMPQAQPEDLLSVKKGENKTVTIETQLDRPLGYLSEKNDEGNFPFPIRVRSEEAEGTIIIPIPP